MTWFALALLGCNREPDPAIVGAFNEARARALAEPAPVGARWAPDLVLHLGSEPVASLIEGGLSQAEKDFRGQIPTGFGVTITTRLELRELKVGPSATCGDCYAATATLGGTVGYDSPVLGKGTVPVDIRSTLDLALATRTTPEAYQISAVPKRVTEVSLDIAGLPRSVVAFAEEKIRALVSDGLSEVEPFPLTAIERDALPVRAFRVAPEGAGLRIELLSEANDPGRVPIRDPELTSGWQLVASARSVLAIARREAFSAPRQALDIVPVPESLSVDGKRFRLGLRLWRLSAPGWWRDYTATGTVAVRQGRIALSAKSVEEGGRSPGAGLADPLALLGEGVILEAITEVLQQTVPASGSTASQGYRAAVAVERIGGGDETIEVGGSLALERIR